MLQTRIYKTIINEIEAQYMSVGNKGSANQSKEIKMSRPRLMT